MSDLRLVKVDVMTGSYLISGFVKVDVYNPPDTLPYNTDVNIEPS
jgi:hypothetical protein